MGIQQAMNMGYQRAMMNRMNSMIQNMARALGSLETQLTNLIKNDKLTDKQKEKLQEKLDEVKELKERIQEAIQNQASIEELEALGGELVELQKSISEVIKEIAEEVKESDKEDDDDVKPEDAKEDDETSDDKKTSKTEHEAKVKDMNDICRRLHTAVSGPGTDYDGPNGLKTILEVGVDEDHIVELFEAWDKSYAKLGDNADDDGGLIETLMDDCEGDEKEEIAGRIIDLLEKRADKLGIDVQSEVAAARVAAAGERHWYTAYIKVRDDDAITTAVNALYKKVKEANDKNISDADKKADETKAEDKKKANEKAQEAKATFLADMREIWDDDKLEISDKVQYKDGKFTIRIQGEVYEASSFKALVKKLEKDDLDPKKYLAKQKVDTKA
jgi:plasmid maintenance system antidote protein VapI